ncbi:MULTISPECIES: 3-oxoacyl-ACP reductase family protein [unclassified Burkholderia]|uniref:SDR family NAD(P)-dependent oxidoreductase n=1 Tax=unclassified Burkholderia TaxID=2613784 RepID=UPI002AB087BD|nr:MULTISPECIES: 3-oxoacyl-ACP reductase family protein [unclassified Burkholderia]
MKLHNKVAIVTGGASGIGRAIVEAYVDEGAKVAIFDVSNDAMICAAEEIRTRGGTVMPVCADVTSSESVRNAFKRVVEEFGTIDILVNNAGIFRTDESGFDDRARHLDMLTTPGPKVSLGITSNLSDEDWDHMLRVNLTGTFYCTREALRIMEKKNCGRIINMASTAGISAIAAHAPNYSAAKGGIVAFTKSVAHEVAGAGIAVNCIAPGYITSPPFEKGVNMMGEERRQRLYQIIPAGRFGKTDEVADLAVYLAGEKAAYMVGQILSINGGVVI